MSIIASTLSLTLLIIISLSCQTKRDIDNRNPGIENRINREVLLDSKPALNQTLATDIDDLLSVKTLLSGSNEKSFFCPQITLRLRAGLLDTCNKGGTDIVVVDLKDINWKVGSETKDFTSKTSDELIKRRSQTNQPNLIYCPTVHGSSYDCGFNCSGNRKYKEEWGPVKISGGKRNLTCDATGKVVDRIGSPICDVGYVPVGKKCEPRGCNYRGIDYNHNQLIGRHPSERYTNLICKFGIPTRECFDGYSIVSPIDQCTRSCRIGPPQSISRWECYDSISEHARFVCTTGREVFQEILETRPQWTTRVCINRTTWRVSIKKCVGFTDETVSSRLSETSACR